MAPIIELSDEVLKTLNRDVYTRRKDLEDKRINGISNIVKSDYIQIPNQNFVTAIAETDFGLNYECAHKQVLKRGLNSHTPKEFMIFHNYIIDCYKNKKTIFDSAGNNLPDEIRDELYTQLTSNCWTWLNGKFNISKDKKTIEYITGLDSQNNLLTKEEDLEDCLMKSCYIDFKKLTKQGLALIKHPNQNFVKGKSIYFYVPRNGVVARFVAGDGRTGLICGRGPFFTSFSLGVRTKAQKGNQGSLKG